MRVGVKEAVRKDHLEHHPGAAVCNPAAVDPGGIQCREIIDLGGDAGPLHLDYHRGAVRQGGGVHLADGGRCHWDLIEIAEHGVDGPTELRLDDGTNQVDL